MLSALPKEAMMFHSVPGVAEVRRQAIPDFPLWTGMVAKGGCIGKYLVTTSQYKAAKSQLHVCSLP